MHFNLTFCLLFIICGLFDNFMRIRTVLENICVAAEYALQAFVSSLVMKLQLYVQQVNGALEETSQSVLSSLPRILRDTQLLQQETLALKEKMVTVKQEIAKVRTSNNFFKYLS